jgi:hypothetical protein
MVDEFLDEKDSIVQDDIERMVKFVKKYIG